jgi:N-acetylglutamate synthase-like GNAT family acetyltransferase
MDVAIAEEKDPKVRRRSVESLTARLPEWFAQVESNRHYAKQAELLEAWVARIGGQAIGLLLLKRHSAVSAEIHWLGVDPDHHRQGIGKTLIGAVERRLRQEKVKFVFVMTLHPQDPYEPYRRTRAFYEQLGFELALSTPHAGSSANPLAYYLKVL